MVTGTRVLKLRDEFYFLISITKIQHKYDIRGAILDFFMKTIDGSSPKSLGHPGILWDPLGGSHRVPEEELKSEFNRKVARNNG